MSRRRKSPKSLGARQSSYTVTTSVGRYPTSYPSQISRLRPLPGLPSPLPDPLPGSARLVRKIAAIQTRPLPPRIVSRPQPAPKRQPGRGRPMFAVKQSELLRVPAPVSRKQPTPCQQRANRRSAMFSAGVAGKKWRAGGPKMWDARHTINSSFTCR